MPEKRLLIADANARAWDEMREALGEAWVVVGAANCDAAMAELEKEAFTVVIANHELAGWGGAELLNRIRAANPRVLRFIAAEPAIKDKLMSNVLGGDRFLPLPFEVDAVKSAIDRAVAVDYGMSDSVRELVGRIRSFPTIPSLYLEVVNALRDPDATTATIGGIIARDMAMTTKLLQMINSAYYGLSRRIVDPVEAVGILGFESVKSLIMTVKLLNQYDKIKPVYFSIDNVWRHSTNVARTAKVMAQLETNDDNISGAAYTAGLMHDLGKIILAANFDSLYHKAHNTARKEHVPLWDVEKQVFGATHGEIGAYLLALWGMPEEVVKVTANHHHPLRAGDTGFSALTAVHVANALEYEGSPEADGMPAAVIDCDYIQQLGVANRIDQWRFARRGPGQEMTRFIQKAQPAAAAAKSSSQTVILTTPSRPPEKIQTAAPRREFSWTMSWRKWLGFVWAPARR